VKIGEQIWMAENLNYDTTGSKCYNNIATNCYTYGRLYDWSTAKTICPIDWHLPSNWEWNVLMKFVEPTCSGNSVTSSCGGAGTKLKATSRWNTSRGYVAGTDNYGFSALPGGANFSDGSISVVGDYGYWWSSSESNAHLNNFAYYRLMFYDNSLVNVSDNEVNSLFSVRCVKD
jgi:uncharacterized protein (TIGR02145 family)